MELAPDRCYRALTARDARFDGAFYVGVSTTGVYCRPICAARTPGRDRCSFYRTAAEAEQAGYRACFRCRPELAPGRAPLDAVPRLAARAVARIEEGALNEGTLDDLAGQLGVSGRQLRRAVEAELGVAPVALAQTRRLALAKQLLQDTRLPLVDVALASGFGSVRRFNALFLARFGKPPSVLRRAGVPGAGRNAGDGAAADGRAGLSLRLDFREPYDWDGLLAFFAARAVPGIERVDRGRYARAVRVGDRAGTLEVRREGRSLRVDISLSLSPVLMKVVSRLRAQFDLDADPHAIAAALRQEKRLARLVARRPGLRVPGAFDPFEATVRAVLGQQVSIGGATTLAGRLAARFGDPISGAGLSRTFPQAAALAARSLDELAAIGLPRARAATLGAVAAAFARGVQSAEDLRGLPGVGPWTLSYVGMRAFRDPDAFPASDLGVRKALGGAGPRDAEALVERARPFRAYAALHLWSSLVERKGSRERR
jgi:AraC family transcriptional regulator of adaptative response / DNA-3-methyladenine glycosylase II